VAFFKGASFNGPPSLDDHGGFQRVVFQAEARFDHSTFCLGARFDRATFEDEADFEHAAITGDAWFGGCDFKRDADFAEPSILAAWLEDALSPPPRLVSMRRAKAAKLTISGLDVRACRFDGARGLDLLRMERVRFAETPSGWWRTGRLPARWTRRSVIAEEHQWRAERAGAVGWGDAEVWSPSPGAPAALTPEQIAATYRALRKGREDSKDEPGAADFYYGEMEMRWQRPSGHDATLRPASRAERLISRRTGWSRATACGRVARSSPWR
jgi:hypothetical protein